MSKPFIFKVAYLYLENFEVVYLCLNLVRLSNLPVPLNKKTLTLTLYMYFQSEP